MMALFAQRQKDGKGTATVAAESSFNLIRWFSLLSLVLISTVAVALGIISTHFVVSESIERDSMLSAQFVQAVAEAEIRHARLPETVTIADLLDLRQPPHPDVPAAVHRQVRDEFLDHIEHLPDALLANIYAPDKVVVWSSNPDLIGERFTDNHDLEQVFKLKDRVGATYIHLPHDREEQQFIRHHDKFFIENYIPLFNAQGKVTAVVEIYKEPHDLIARIKRGLAMIWLATLLGGAVLFFGLFRIVRRASRLLSYQQHKLVDNETFVLLGEMSSAIAHSLRNPLASIRSSAELALELEPEDARKSIGDIIGQVDRMSHWVRELLVSARPVNTHPEPVNLPAVLKDCLAAFEHQLKQSGIRVEATLPSVPPVMAHTVLLGQVLHNVLANAIEAMPDGGWLRLRLDCDKNKRKLWLTIADSGKGMSRQQKLMAFRPFYTTKQGGLGVGLVMVKRIMERFGGEVSLNSTENTGTTICLGFSLTEGESNAA